ncbi:MAG: hypothetical protein E6K76_00350 [Candidatus Eisenbacteria bacterium]|uniref:Uncharacterized protein n=1 Tax=Eiseniibacteriota bacterium TaxID=2212470 RepID=A0A538TBD8_UNCEI|nr:MAG: hypothetical protein E6K76_00350 [Candidatus Eisenbacteria bacterium]
MGCRTHGLARKAAGLVLAAGLGMCAASPASAITYPGFIDMVTDPTLVFAVPIVGKPAYQSPFTDLVFRTRVTRIANDPGASTAPVSGTWGSDARHHYSKTQPWNSDNSLIVIENRNGGSPASLILDGSTYLPKLAPCGSYSPYDYRWHPSPAHANEQINVDGSGAELMWFNVATCTKTRTWTLPVTVNYGIGSGEGNPSNDGRYVALASATQLFVVDMDPQPPLAPYPNKRIGPVYDVSSCGLSGGCSIDWVSISASGKYAVVSYNGDYPRIFDVNPTTLALTPHPMLASSPRCNGGSAAQGFTYDLGHADVAVNPFDNNEDVLIGQEHCGNRGKVVNGVLIGGVVMVRLRDGAITPLTDATNEAYPHHISTRNLDRPGWAYVGYYPEIGKRFCDEIIAVKLDGSKAVQRFAHKHSVFSGCYRCESHPVPSRDGRRVIFASNWADNCGALCGSSSVIQDYVVDARGAGTGDSVPPSPVSNLLAR